jgi:hypothetical protein
MGIDHNALRFLVLAKADGVDFSRTLTIGRQRIYVPPRLVPDYLRTSAATPGEPYAEDLFRALGARDVASLDRSAYEGASVLHDLGTPLPSSLRGRHSVVFDAGTLEHVFNFPQALKNCMELVAPGGHFITCTGANNFCGHGFYQFSPELFYRALAIEHGFAVERMIACDARPHADWHAVRDPAVVRRRVEIVGPYQVMLMVLAKRVVDVEPFQTLPQQSDYERAWEGDAHPDYGGLGASTSSSRGVRRLLPRRLIDAVVRRRSAAQYPAPSFERVPPAAISRARPGPPAPPR